VSVPAEANGFSTGPPGPEVNLQHVIIQTARGPVDVVYDLQPEGETLHLKDLMVYPQSAVPLSGVLRELLAARSQIAAYAKEAGFAKLRITGHRTLQSTSANPGKRIDVTIQL
jgi:hypothetical protein